MNSSAHPRTYFMWGRLIFAVAGAAGACASPDSEPSPRSKSGAVAVVAHEPSKGASAEPLQMPDDAAERWALRHAETRPLGVKFSRIAVYGAERSIERKQPAREVRVVLHFDGVAVYRRGELPAEHGLPRRLVLDLDGVTVGSEVPRALAIDAGGLARVRTFALDEGRTRVSFDVQPSTAYRLFFLSDPFRVVMDFREATRPGHTPSNADPMVVVLDPGHGGAQPGAKSHNGLKEAHVALALALRVRRALLRKHPALRVVMTRSQDHFISLEERSAIANAVDADVFVSIHLNASHSGDDLGGVSTFVLDTTDDQAALRLAAAENGTDVEDVGRLQLILASLVRKDQVEHSRVLAHDVQQATLHAGRRLLPDLHDRGVKAALFYVLVGAQMPAVLIEASFLTQKREAEALATEPYRQALAEGIAEGLLRYLERPPPAK